VILYGVGEGGGNNADSPPYGTQWIIARKIKLAERNFLDRVILDASDIDSIDGVLGVSV
jgi:hypothetical protein